MSALLAVMLTAAVAAAGPAENLARGNAYTLFPQPNYRHCTDPGDTTQLTDGQTTDSYFWTQPGTVGWQTVQYAAITVDLGRVEPIGGVSLRTAAGRAGVQWPGAIRILTSEDGKTYRNAGDLVELDHKVNGPWPEEYAIRRLVTTKLRTRGRFVRFLVLPGPGSPYTFVDEIEVLRGPAELLQGEPGGEAVGDMKDLFARWRIESGVRRRFEADVAGIRRAIRTAELDNESVRAGLLKQLDAAAAALRASSVATDKTFRAVLPLNEAHGRLFAVQAALWKAQGRPELLYWVPPTWDPVDPYAVPPKQSFGEIEVHLMHGEHRAVAVNLANSTQNPIRVMINAAGPRRSAAGYLSPDGVQWTDTSAGRAVAAAMHDAWYIEQFATVTVPPGLVRQLWVDNYFHNRPANRRFSRIADGEHSGVLTVSSRLDYDLNIPIRLHFYPLDFPKQTTLMLGGWTYSNGGGRYGITPDNRKALVGHLKEHGVNAPWASSSVMARYEFSDDGKLELDTQELDEWIAEWPDAKRYHVFLSIGDYSRPAARKFAGAEIGTAEFDRRVGTWISAWVRHLKGKGVGPNRLALLLHDEPHEGTDVGPLVAWAKAIHAAEPDVLVWEDPTYRDPGKAPPELFEAADVLCPNRPMWLAQGEAFGRFYLDQQQRGRELQLYSCSGPAKLLDPYSYYRLQAWHCWQIGATGSFFWAFGDNSGASSWNPYLARAGPYTPLFIDQQTVTPGKHMEAIREGVQDFEYLVMLRKAVEQAKAAGRSDVAVTRAEKLLATAADEVLSAKGADRLHWHDPKDRTIAEGVRVRILETLTMLKHGRGKS